MGTPFLYPAPVRLTDAPGACSLPAVCTLYAAPGSFSPQRAGEICFLWQGFTFGAGELRILEDERLPRHSARIGGGASCELEPGDAYALCVGPQGVSLRADSGLSLLHGMYTLLQCIVPKGLEPGKEAFSIGCVEIHDHPALVERMLHICVFPETTLCMLEKYIRMAALLKMTHIVLEFWGMIQLDCIPEWGWAGRAYTKEQIRPLAALARSLGLEIVPMINHLGHASQSRVSAGRHVFLDQNPRLGLLFEPDGWTWCLSNPRVHTLLRSAREEMMDLCGEGGYFHLGCDEAYSFRTCPRCAGRDGPGLLAEYLNGLAEELAGRGRRGIIWGDALLEKAAWSSPNIATSRPDQQTHLALDRLDRRLIIADWQYYLTDSKAGMPTAQYFTDRGFEVLAAPWLDAKNPETLAWAARAMGLRGWMLTTWHRQPHILRELPLYASQAWHGGPVQQAAPEAAVLYTHAAAMLRKAMPLPASLEEAGFFPRETIQEAGVY